METERKTLSVGSIIPELTAKAYQNNKEIQVNLKSYKGKWLVLLFYPADFTFICPTELEEAAKLYPDFQKENAEVLSINTDTVFVHKAWHDHSPSIAKINFPMLADPTGNICSAFGTYIENEGLSLRASIIINPEGKILLTEIHDNSIGRSVSEILRKLRAAKFVSEHPGEVCPVNWQPGSKTLKPGLDLVGKI